MASGAPPHVSTGPSRRAWAVERIASTVGIPRGYLQDEGPFPERLPWLILTGQFPDEFVHAVARWTEWAHDLVEGRPDDIRAAEPDWATLESMAVQGEAFLSAERRRASAARSPVANGPREDAPRHGESGPPCARPRPRAGTPADSTWDHAGQWASPTLRAVEVP